MNHVDKEYLKLVNSVLNTGDYTKDRTGTGCYSKTGAMMEFDLQKGFPLLTTKKIFPKNIFGEAMWFMSGKTDLESLRKYSDKPEGSHTIWSDDFLKRNLEFPNTALEDGGAIYGHQWRHKKVVHPDLSWIMKHDQIGRLLQNMRSVIDGDYTQARRLIVDSWDAFSHTTGKKFAALPACHDSFQCLIRGGGKRLDLRFHMRSNDLFLGCPYNIASYAFIAHVLAQLTGLKVGKLVYFATDAHIYSNHVDQVLEQLTRHGSEKLPTLVMPEFSTLEEFLQLTAKDFELEGYEPDGFIKAPQAS